MDSAKERFIELATQPLSDNAELKLAAVADLQHRIEENRGSNEDLERAAEALKRAKSRPFRRAWRPVLYLTTLAVSLAALFPMIHEARALYQISKSLSAMGGLLAPAQSQLETKFPPTQRLLLFGDERISDDSGRWRPLWQSQPDNRVYLAKYAKECFLADKELPPEILDAAGKIDTDNGWYDAAASSFAAHGAVTKKSQTSAERKAFKPPKWTISDRTKLNESLRLLHQAMEKPRFANYEAELLKAQLPLLPEPYDFTSQLVPVSYLGLQTTFSVRIRIIADALSAAAQECAFNHDAEGFQRLVGDWEKLASRNAETGISLIDLLVARSIFLSPASNFQEAAASLGLKQEAERFSRIVTLQKLDKEWRERERRNYRPEGELLRKHGALYAGLAIPVTLAHVKHPPPLGYEDLKPSRFAEYSYCSRVASGLALLLFGLCAGLAALQRLIQSRLHRLLSKRLTDLLGMSDWLWIFGGGILLPLFWYVAIIHLTPFSSREWSFRADGFRQTSCQFGGLIILMFVLSIAITRSRIAKRGCFLALNPSMPRMGWMAAISSALAIPLAGTILPAAHSGYSQSTVIPCLVGLTYLLLAFPLLWLIVGFCPVILGKPAHALRRATTARLLVPTWIFGVLAMAISIPIHHAEEGYWVRRDRLFAINPDQPGLCRYEWQVTQQLRKELLEMMDQNR